MKYNEIIKKLEEQRQTKNINNYYKGVKLNIAKSFTDFIKYIEKRAEEENIFFSIIGGNVAEVIPYKEATQTEDRKIYREKKEYLFSNYVTFIYDNIYYYFQISDNPFFEHYYCKITLLKNEKGFYYMGNKYMHNMNPLGNIDIKELYSINDEARKQIKNNLINEFENATECKTYRGCKRSNQINYISENVYYAL